MELSAAAVLYRRGPRGWEVLLVHPSGNYNRRAPWSFPKGVPDAGETAEAAARRECSEETGVVPQTLCPLGSVKYRSGRKEVVAFYGPAPEDAQPRCASWEVDRAEFVRLEEARRLLHPDQALLLDKLAQLLSAQDVGQPESN
ncbi:MAG: hypothetical protein KatS3mg110_0184 [Pirellulaceae bacterium]|nr:MAG: hypothetical protein KatS3mg110_0184 [Pirellulaceae bacterium]